MVSFQLWYLDDCTFAETRSAVEELLKHFRERSPSFGLTSILRSVRFWPSGDSAFGDFPPEVSHPLQVSYSVELMGAPIFRSDQYYGNFTDVLFDKVKHLQDLLPDLEDPQAYLYCPTTYTSQSLTF